MSSTYLKFLSRNKLYTFIEVFGLSVALGFVILLASYARTEFSVGAKQPLSKQLYVVGAGDSFGMTLGTSDEFFPSIPEIKSWTKICVGGDVDIMVGDDYYKAAEASIDTNFFNLFDYRLAGCPKDRVLENEDEVILSESLRISGRPMCSSNMICSQASNVLRSGLRGWTISATLFRLSGLTKELMWKRCVMIFLKSISGTGISIRLTIPTTPFCGGQA